MTRTARYALAKAVAVEACRSHPDVYDSGWHLNLERHACINSGRTFVEAAT